MEKILDEFSKLKVLVVGDVILDKYYETEVNRISPEAPIPVAKFNSDENILGGAANVALNVSKLGAETYLVGGLGNDDNGVFLNKLINNFYPSINFFPVFLDMKTITKIRIVSNSHQLLRLDFEDLLDSNKIDYKKIIKEIDLLLDKIDLIIVSDYRKGFISKDLIEYFSKLDKYVAIDTKPGVFTNFHGFNLIKPNFEEAVGIARSLGNNKSYKNIDFDVEDLGRFLVDKLNSNILITRNKEGVSYIGKNNNIFHSKSKVIDLIDVTGAGDTSIAIFSLLDYLNFDKKKSLDLMNIAAKITVSHFGNYSPTIDEIKKEVLVNFTDNLILNDNSLDVVLKELRKNNKKIVFTNGCFDILHSGHISYLNTAKKLGDILIVGVNSDDSVRRLKGNSRPIINEDSRLYVLSNLKSVDYVILFNEDTPIKLIEKIKPDFHVKGGDYKISDLPEADIVKSYGGEIRIIDIEENISTTKIITRIKNY